MVWVKIVLLGLKNSSRKSLYWHKRCVGVKRWAWCNVKCSVHFGYACFGLGQLGLAGCYKVYGSSAVAVFLQGPFLQKFTQIGCGANFATYSL